MQLWDPSLGALVQAAVEFDYPIVARSTIRRGEAFREVGEATA